MVACGVNETGQREILAVEPMLEESEEAYLQFFRSLKDRGLRPPKLVISDANTGLISAIRKGFVRASGARCKVHFMRNILVHVSHKSGRDLLPSSRVYGWLQGNLRLVRGLTY